MNVVVVQPCMILGAYAVGMQNGNGIQGPNIPSGGLPLQIPQFCYDSQTMTRIGTNPLDPRVAAVIPWTTTINGPWPYPIPNE